MNLRNTYRAVEFQIDWIGGFRSQEEARMDSKILGLIRVQVVVSIKTGNSGGREEQLQIEHELIMSPFRYVELEVTVGC